MSRKFGPNPVPRKAVLSEQTMEVRICGTNRYEARS